MQANIKKTSNIIRFFFIIINGDAMYREILTKAIVAKGEKKIINKHELTIENDISRILGCWIINHKYQIITNNQKIIINGTYDAYFWYGYNEDSSCGLSNNTYSYSCEIPYTFSVETLNINNECQIKEHISKPPTCIAMTYNKQTMNIEVEIMVNIDIIGETKLKIKVDDVIIDQVINTNYMNKNNG